MAKLIKKGSKIRSNEEISWEKLVEQIWAGNVIPVIGDNLVVSETTIIKDIVDYLAEDKKIQTSPKTFSELYYDNDFKPHQPVVYEEVSSLIKLNQPDIHPIEILKDFLSIEQFPFVITTSVDYTVEETMREIWSKRGRKLRTLVFSNNSKENDDIKTDADIKEPTVYYMFGKANKNREHSFVLTEEDMLSFCQSWLSDKHPQLLSKVIGQKYLLFFGVNYPDWLIRFIWFSMRNNLRDSGMLVDNRNIESSLLDFFQRVSIRTQSAPYEMVVEIKQRLEKKKKEHEERKFDSAPTEELDFFISYSHRDLSWAQQLYQSLTSMGYKVWFDKKNISIGSDWEYKIRQGIRRAKYFIALLSENIAIESNEHHPYRSEWDIALAHRLSNKKYVIPVCVGKTDIYADIDLKLPEDLAYIQSIVWEDKNVIDNVIKEITAL